MWPAHNWFWAALFGALLGERDSRLSFLCVCTCEALLSLSSAVTLKTNESPVEMQLCCADRWPFYEKSRYRWCRLSHLSRFPSVDILISLLISEWANWSNSFSYANAAAVPQRHLTAGDYESTDFVQISTHSLKNVIDKWHYSTTKASIDVWWWFANGSS